MAETIVQIKRSLTSNAPENLKPGEFAYSSSEQGSTGLTNGVLYIGGPTTDPQGNSTTKYVIGGTKYTNLLDVTPGQWTASKTLIVGADGKIDKIVTNEINGVAGGDGATQLVIGSADDENQKIIIYDPYFENAEGEVVPVSQYIEDLVKGGMINIVAGDGIADISNVEGTYTIALKPTGVSQGTYGSETKVPSFTINQYGQLTNIEEKTISTTMTVTNVEGDETATVNLVSGKLIAADGLKVTNSSEGQAQIDVDETVVRTTGTQTISGTKTFDTAPKINSETITTKEYVDQQIPEVITSKIGSEIQAHSDQLDKLAALATAGFIGRKDDGSIANFTVEGTIGQVQVTPDTASGKVTIALEHVGTAGTYTKVTTDDQGRVTAGENPTTLAGYGITDAVNKAGDTMTGALKVVDPVAPEDAVNKKYADSIALGFVPHKPVKVAETSNVEGVYADGTSKPGFPGVGATFTMTQSTLDGQELSENDRVLLLGQTDQKQNGIYNVTAVQASTSATLTRVDDFDGEPTISYDGLSVLVSGGTKYGTVYTLQNRGPLTFGTDNIVFIETFVPNGYTAGTGISISNKTIAVKVGTTIQEVSGKLEVASGSGNEGKVLVAQGDGSAATWKALSLDDLDVGVISIENGGTGNANSDPNVMKLGNITLTASGESNVTVPTSGTLATLAGNETLTNKVVKSDTAGDAALKVQNGNIVGESYMLEDQSVQPKLEGFVIDCGTY